MNEILLNEILNDYCKDNNEISSRVKEGEFYAVVNCNLDSAENIVQLVSRYMEETNETLKLKYKKKSKSEKGNLRRKCFIVVITIHAMKRLEMRTLFTKRSHSRDLEIHSVHFKYLSKFSKSQ